MSRRIDDIRLFGVGILNDEGSDADARAEWTEEEAREYHRLVALSESVWEGSDPMDTIQEMIDDQLQTDPAPPVDDR
jgi:hypothetical protein